MKHGEQKLLRLLSNHPFVTLGWAAQQGLPGNRDEIHVALNALVRKGLASYDVTANRWNITEEGAMRFRSTKNSPAAAPNRNQSGDRRDLNGGGGSNSGAGATHPASAPASTATTEAEALLVEMDPHALAFRAVREEADLHERLTAAIADGLPPLDLLDVPRRKRLVAVEDALDGWEKSTIGGPCSVCGTVSARAGYIAQGSMVEPSRPSFINGRCLWCHEALRHITADRLRSMMLGALVGLKNLNGTNAGVPFYSELKERLPDLRPSTEPWGYISPALLSGIVKALDLPRHCYVTTPREQIIHSFDTITARIWAEDELPTPRVYPPVFVEPSPNVKRAEKEYAAFRARREAEKADWIKQREATFDLVDASGGAKHWRERIRANS